MKTYPWNRGNILNVPFELSFFEFFFYYLLHYTFYFSVWDKRVFLPCFDDLIDELISVLQRLDKIYHLIHTMYAYSAQIWFSYSPSICYLCIPYSSISYLVTFPAYGAKIRLSTFQNHPYHLSWKNHLSILDFHRIKQSDLSRYNSRVASFRIFDQCVFYAIILPRSPNRKLTKYISISIYLSMVLENGFFLIVFHILFTVFSMNDVVSDDNKLSQFRLDSIYQHLSRNTIRANLRLLSTNPLSTHLWQRLANHTQTLV